MLFLEKIIGAFPAFKHTNYQLYFAGQLVSMIGTWLQVIAQGWLVLQITHSAYWVGVVSAIGTFPSLIFSLFGGVIVDRFPKKNILYFTQISSMVLALLLGILTVAGYIQLWQIIIIAFLLGIVNALDGPARLSFAVEMVGKEDLPSAIALNSAIFNGARVVGPGVAGILIASFGVGGAFILNGLSFIAVIFALFLMKVKEIIADIHPNPIRAIKEGLSYSFSHPLIGTLLIFTGITSVFGWSYVTIMPVVADEVFHRGVSDLGLLYVSAGVGALIGTVVVSAFAKRFSPVNFILAGNFIFTSMLIIFTYTNNFYLALFFMCVSGFGLIIQFSMMNATIQGLVKDSFRGRVMSIYMLMFLGLSPLGNFQIGYFAEHFGSMLAIRLGAVVVLISGAIFFFYRSKIQLLHSKYID